MKFVAVVLYNKGRTNISCFWSCFLESQFTVHEVYMERLWMEIQNVKTWLDAKKSTLNEEKTEYMLIGSGKRLRQIRNDPIIKIRDHIIKRVYKKTVLGLEIDDKLQWTKHVCYVNLYHAYMKLREKGAPVRRKTTRKTKDAMFDLLGINMC